MRRKFSLALLVLAILILQPILSAADLHLPAIFSDNMVLQRNFATPIWGTADPNTSITLTIADQKKQATADANGKWMIKLDPIKEGGPYELSISGPGTITYKNVLFGDVWICSGQSNMEFALRGSKDAATTIPQSTNPTLRLFTVKKNPANAPVSDVTGKWEESSPTSSPGFSAVGYYFGAELQKQLNIPIGLIHTSWGGTAIQLWQSKEAMEADEDMKAVFAAHQTNVERYEAAKKKYDEAAAKAKAEGKPAPANAPRAPMGPASLYNGMIAPLVPYGITGATWYQGESNAGNAKLYRKQMPAMINQWRKEFGREFPFYMVQLANYQAATPQPVDSDWAELREAQLQTAQTNPKTGMAVIIDIGEAKDIHPKNKEDVGKRLALAALGQHYEKKIVYSGPIYADMKTEGSKIRLNFHSTGSGLMAKPTDATTAEPAKLKGFAIAGEDKRFVWADAQIDGNSVIVSSPDVQNPVAVRYGWANNPDCNLYNKEGLPASPFRTDNWPKAGAAAAAK